MAKSKDNGQETPAKNVVNVKALGDLARRKITVVIERDDEELVIPCQTMTWKRWNALGMQVPDPVPPINGVDKNTRPIHDYNDPAYLRGKAEAETQRLYLRLVEFLDIDIPGETVEEKIAALEETLEVGVVNRLSVVMGQFTREGEARIETRAATFLDTGQGGHADVPA